MSLKNKILKESIKDNNWLAEAKKRRDNEDWLEVSFSIAVKILRYIRNRKISQKSIAKELGCSPQYFSRILKGKENLTLETICKIQNVLGIHLIQVPTFYETIEYKYEPDVRTSSVLKKGNFSSIQLEETYLKEKEEISHPINVKFLQAA